MERIIAAAYKVKPEFVTEKGCVIKIGSKDLDDIYQCRIGRHHAEILHCFGHEVDHHTDGFYTSHGRWVDRKEAARIALACGQIKRLHYWDDKLDSSDIFDWEKENDSPQWKPTPAQVEALETAEGWYSDNMGCNMDLFNLLEDIRKLV